MVKWLHNLRILKRLWASLTTVTQLVRDRDMWVEFMNLNPSYSKKRKNNNNRKKRVNPKMWMFHGWWVVINFSIKKEIIWWPKFNWRYSHLREDSMCNPAPWDPLQPTFDLSSLVTLIIPWFSMRVNFTFIGPSFTIGLNLK